MEIKLINSFASSMSVKIRPLWDGNNVLAKDIFITWEWLKSDHCGMEIFLCIDVQTYQQIWLKSDHCGMEIVLMDKRKSAYLMLKSDHCGMEIN